MTDPVHPEALTSREAQRLLRFDTADGAVAFLRRHGLRPIRRGRTFLWRTSGVLALIQNAPPVLAGQEV